MKKLITVLAILVLAGWIYAGDQAGVSITIYNSDLGLVKDVRSLAFSKGTNIIDFDEVASQIDATSVNFNCLDGKLAVLEQNFLYDLVSTEALLKRYLGKSIEIICEENKTYKGKLLSYDARNVILGESEGQVVMVALSKIVDYKFPSLPEGLILKPTLRWQIDSPNSGNKNCEVSYLTGGIKWQADYVAVVSKDDDYLDLSGWVTIDNRSGTAYKDAKLKLVAGDVHRVSVAGRPLVDRYEMATSAKGMGRPQFEEESFFEYHLYTLTRPATLNDKEIKQLSLFPPAKTEAQKVYIFDAQQRRYYRQSQDKIKIKVNLEFENSEKAGMGMPLPKGKLRVYKKDSQGALQFVGEDLIDHTPKDEKVRVYLGDAFDITGKRQVMSKVDIEPKYNHYRESYKITLNNHKDEDIVVTVVEHPNGWREWNITKSSIKYRKIDNYKIEFEVPVAANSETELTYTIQY